MIEVRTLLGGTIGMGQMYSSCGSAGQLFGENKRSHHKPDAAQAVQHHSSFDIMQSQSNNAAAVAYDRRLNEHAARQLMCDIVAAAAALE